MKDKDKTRIQLIEELIELRQRIAELEKSDAGKKWAEETLEKSEKQYRDMVDNSPVGIYKTSLQGDILYVNEALCRIVGYESPEEFIPGGVLSKYKNKKNREMLIKKLKEKGSVNNFEVELIKKNGDSRMVLLSAVLDGNIISGMMVDITRRKKMEKRLQEAAITDDLTGLFNRRGFLTISEKHCKLADRTKRGISLLYLDLDGMKTINDELGHKAGDQALVDTANVLKNSFRESDIIARMGGDEFAVLLTELSKPNIEHIIINHLQDNLRIHNEQEDLTYELWLSIGIAHYNPEQPCSIDDLINRADTLMYEDKKHHKLEEKEKIEKRAFKRFESYDNFTVELGSSAEVTVKNISLGGICLKTAHQLTAENRYKIRMLATDDKEITPTGIVVWSSLTEAKTEKDDNFPSYETGLKFIKMNDSLKNSLEKFVTNLAN